MAAGTLHAVDHIAGAHSALSASRHESHPSLGLSGLELRLPCSATGCSPEKINNYNKTKSQVLPLSHRSRSLSIRTVYSCRMTQNYQIWHNNTFRRGFFMVDHTIQWGGASRDRHFLINQPLPSAVKFFEWYCWCTSQIKRCHFCLKQLNGVYKIQCFFCTNKLDKAKKK